MEPKFNYLIIDDEERWRDLYKKCVAPYAKETLLADNAVAAIEIIAKNPEIHFIISDLFMEPNCHIDKPIKEDKPFGGAFLIREIQKKQLGKNLEVLLVSDKYDAKDSINKWLRGYEGFYRFIEKTLDEDEIVDNLLGGANAAIIERQKPIFTLSKDPIIFQSKKMKDVVELTCKAAQTDLSVLITGDSGTGKELFARLIHTKSPLAKQKYMGINCGAVPDNLVEAELFGYEKGAYTGATTTHKGIFEDMNGGTLFLDEVAEMSIETQVKLFRAIEYGEIKRLGSNDIKKVKVRIIAATNADLKQKIKNNEFRNELYQRLNIIEICIPPLRERPEDISVLSEFLIQHLVKKTVGINPRKISDEAHHLLEKYHFLDGNVRTLQRLLTKAIFLANDEKPDCKLKPEHFPEILHEEQISVSEKVNTTHGSSILPEDGIILKDEVEKYEKNKIIDALTQTNNNKTESAKLLGVSRTNLQNKIKKYNIICQE